MNLDGISAVTFDAGGTMIYCDPSPAEIYAHHLSCLGRPVDADEVGPVFRDAWAEMQRRAEAGKDRYSSVVGGERAWWGNFVREVLGRLDHDAEWEPLLDRLYKAFSDADVWKVFPETTHTLKELRAAGARLGVISNWDRRLPDILRSMGLIENFDVVTVSAIEGVEKPAPAIFASTVSTLGVSPETVVHVGDSPLEDYTGAENAGLTPVLVDRNDLFVGGAYRRISSLAQILDIGR